MRNVEYNAVLPHRSSSELFFPFVPSCPLLEEQAAAMAMLDQVHHMPPRIRTEDFDLNAYTIGSIMAHPDKHHIVIAKFSHGVTGNHPAAEVANTIKKDFKNIRVALI